jgi:hypothetical protein
VWSPELRWSRPPAHSRGLVARGLFSADPVPSRSSRPRPHRIREPGPPPTHRIRIHPTAASDLLVSHPAQVGSALLELEPTPTGGYTYHLVLPDNGTTPVEPPATPV